jgi:nucleotide-binding universal stress UspA family protein
MIHVKKILYPTDFSSYSNQAYLHAVALAENHGASLTIVYVFAPGADDTANGDRRFWRNQLEQIRPTNPNIPVHHVFLEGDPAGEIVRYARDTSIDVIVLGTHGRTGVERLLMGSVAEKVMRDAPCSVLVVKLPRGVSAAERPVAAADEDQRRETTQGATQKRQGTSRVGRRPAFPRAGSLVGA